MLKERIEAVLAHVEKPARYTGGELNMCVKDPSAVDVRFALAFPDTYEVGMSHLGSKILYHCINMRKDTYCERVFAPWVDMEEYMREEGIPLFSLETFSPIADFDMVGFTLQYEMSYSNVLNMLELAGIPLRSDARGAGDPLIIAGGPCAFNPEPLAPFIDLFVLGEGEEVTHELLDLYARERTLDKETFLLHAAQRIAGVYVPRFYEETYHADGTLAGRRRLAQVPARIQKRIVSDVDKLPYPEAPIVPYIGIVHDRIMLEVFRGCTRGCRFCQAGMIYRPLREKSAARVVELARAQVASTGYEEISLTSLSTGDYSHLDEVAGALNAAFDQKRVSVSLPSLRIDSFTEDMARQSGRVRKSGLTFAPEAGSQRLRDCINKNVTQEDLMRTVHTAFSLGWNTIKLYFMVGLPTETMADIDALAKLVHGVCDVYYALPKEQRAPGLRVTASTSNFVPKAHTPFQWCGQDSIALLHEKQQYLRQALKRRGITYNWHEAYLSRMEAAFALGDRRLADVLEAAHRRGCRFDGWDEHFSYEKWCQAFDDCGLDIAFFANRARDLDEMLPWDHIDCGVRKAYLQKEWARAKAGVTTPDCRQGCTGCGAATFGAGVCV
nr:TIGR03960 family B12-binding radical SAM protein [Maliibacterium massiliense]